MAFNRSNFVVKLSQSLTCGKGFFLVYSNLLQDLCQCNFEFSLIPSFRIGKGSAYSLVQQNFT